MLRSFGISAVLLGSVLALAQPQTAAARDRDGQRYDRGRGFDRDRRYGERHERGERHGREEWREHERWEHRYRPGYYNGYYNGYNNNGYGDPRYGFFDQYGYWHWY
ncbi:MAG TPA: hypothetical protein VEV17_08420 [Bryobacteraceae bacterium]|nr:hypothetical protein [Bryobacteraceae bacterium]